MKLNAKFVVIGAVLLALLHFLGEADVSCTILTQIPQSRLCSSLGGKFLHPFNPIHIHMKALTVFI